MRALLISFLWFSQLALGALEFESEVVEVEAAADAEKVTVDFNFKNTGKEAVKISHVDPDCDCISIMVKGGKLNYQPGESGQVRGIFKVSNERGVIDEVIAIWLKDDPKDKPSIRLTARMKIPKVINMNPRSLKWSVGAKSEPQRITVIMDHKKPVHITKTNSSSPNFEIKLETIEEGKTYALWVHPLSTEKPGITVIEVITDSDVKNQKTEQVFAMVQRPE